MSLEEDALRYLHGLGDAWQALFREVAGLDLRSPDLAAELVAERRIERSGPGFGDFDPSSRRAVVPGDPAASLIYHALASPLVKPAGAGGSDYPAPAELDLIENWILSLAPLDPAEIPENAVVAVMAYEYRPGPFTTHRLRADFAWSRTGIGRVGEVAAIRDGAERCWLSLEPDSGRFAVMPARYAAFLAVPRRRTGGGISVLGPPQDDDDDRQFLLPIRKLFPGPGCIKGCELEVRFAEFHRREKLRRIFTESDLEKPPGLDGPPYVRASGGAETIAGLESAGSSVLVSAPPAPLVRLARLASGEIATFAVPRRRALPLLDLPLNRDPGAKSTFMIITGGLAIAGIEEFLQDFGDVSLRPRNAPEFVNMRHRPTADPAAPLEDMSLALGADFQAVLDEGGYRAALFEDSVADGCLSAQVAGLGRELAIRPAFSIIAAPKFFPYADETDLSLWVNALPEENRRDQFKRGGPRPLHLGRFPPNLTLDLPGSEAAAFTAADDTAVAVVGAPATVPAGRCPQRPQYRTTTYLSDGCSDVFAPGWDVSFGEQNGIRFYATFGLGSPFPEDVKLCAAASAYWPAASPDAARTFHRGPTAIPMLDCELGYHPDNPRRIGPSTVGWDGEQGPFIEGEAVNYASIARSDYVSHAFADHTFSGARLKDVDSVELIARMDALRFCIQSLTECSGEVDETRLWLVSAEKHAAPPPGATEVGAPCYRYEFVVPEGRAAATADPRRMRQTFAHRYVCYVAEAGVCWARTEAGPFTFVNAGASA